MYNVLNVSSKNGSISDYIPVVSTFTNLISLIGKNCVFPRLKTEDMYTKPYYSFVASMAQKENLRSIALLVPVLGNIVVLIHDFITGKGFFGTLDYFSKKPIKGFVYEIKLQQRTCGYLFGTQHQLTKAAKISPKLQEAINKCTQVYVESNAGLNSEEITGTPFQTKYGLDNRIAADKPVYSLEDIYSRQDDTTRFSFQMAITASNYDFITPAFKAFWTGNENGIKEVLNMQRKIASNELNLLVFERSRNWLPVMTRALNQASQTIAIAVGATHLFDIDAEHKGCITLLKEAGFELTRVPT